MLKENETYRRSIFLCFFRNDNDFAVICLDGTSRLWLCNHVCKDTVIATTCWGQVVRLSGNGLVLRGKNSAQHSPEQRLFRLWSVDRRIWKNPIGVAKIIGSGLLRERWRRSWRREIVFTLKIVAWYLIRSRSLCGRRRFGVGERCHFVVSIMVLVAQIESILHLTFRIRCRPW